MSKKKDLKKGRSSDDPINMELNFKIPKLEMPAESKLHTKDFFKLPAKFLTQKSCLSKMKKIHQSTTKGKV